MSSEEKSRFDGFEIDEVTGEVIIPRASVGVVSKGTEGAAEETVDYIAAGEEPEELPVLHFDFDFGEEEFADPAEEDMDEDMILQSIDEALAAQMAVTLGPVEQPEKKQPKKKKKLWQRIPMWCRVSMITVASLCLVLCFLIGTKPGRKVIYGILADYVSDNVSREENVTPAPQITDTVAQPVPTQPVDPSGDAQVTPGQPVVPSAEPRHEEYVYNVLLIGVEALPQIGGERSDSMILVSVNSKTRKIYMTSLMRDMYVQIPGYSDHKLNAAYAYGGAQLLVDTVETNLQVKIDGYIKVGFDSFEWIIDRLGGLEMTLTAEEAAYLRRTNYISNPAYRNVVAGTQVLNGNQVLGYCRVRKVPTVNGTQSDFGRTERQRTVLTKLFNKYKDSNIFTLISVLNDCLPQVLTDISKSDMQMVLETVVENRILDLENFRIPASGTFDDVKMGGDIGDVLLVRWAKNIDLLHEKIFDDNE